MAAAGANLKIKIPKANAGSNTSEGSKASIIANRNAFQRLMAAEEAAAKEAAAKEAAAKAAAAATTNNSENENTNNGNNANNGNGLPFPIEGPFPGKYLKPLTSTTASLASMTPRSTGSPLSFASAPGSMGGRRRRSRKGKSKKYGHRKSKKAIRRKRSTRRR